MVENKLEYFMYKVFTSITSSSLSESSSLNCIFLFFELAAKCYLIIYPAIVPFLFSIDLKDFDANAGLYFILYNGKF